MANSLLSIRSTCFVKGVFIAGAIFVLLLKTEQHFSEPFLIILLHVGGYYLGKIICSAGLKYMGIGITLLVFILMNIVHSFVDGISLTGQSLFYGLSVIVGHEAFRQPTLYIILWSILKPFSISSYSRIVICFTAVTIAWLIGLWLGKLSGAAMVYKYNLSQWMGYSIFLFIGDIIHHLTDQYRNNVNQKDQLLF